MSAGAGRRYLVGMSLTYGCTYESSPFLPAAQELETWKPSVGSVAILTYIQYLILTEYGQVSRIGLHQARLRQGMDAAPRSASQHFPPSVLELELEL